MILRVRRKFFEITTLPNERGCPRASRAPPPPLVLLGLGEGGRPPLFLFPPWQVLVQVGLGGGGNPTPGGSRTPWRAKAWPASPSPLLLYIRGQGGTLEHTS